MVPETRYARSGNLHIAYQVTGNGPVDLVFVHGWISHIEHLWEEPSIARLLNRLASFSRLILLDKRGTGLSDPVALDQLPTLEERMDDLRAVMDAAGSERAALLGTSEAGALNLLFLYVDLGNVDNAIGTNLVPVAAVNRANNNLATGSTSFFSQNHVIEQIIRVGLNYKFNALAAPVAYR